MLLTSTLGAFACSRSETPAPVPAKTPAPALTFTLPERAPDEDATATPINPSTPNPSASAAFAKVDLNDFSDVADWQWNLQDEAESEDFEIDADATSMFMPQGNTVAFKAKALNGTPPFTFEWDFNDGAPKVRGEMVKHIFTKLGTFDVTCTGRDASGADYTITLSAMVITPEDWAARTPIEVRKHDDPQAPAGAADAPPRATP